MGLPAAQPGRSAVHTTLCHWSRAATTLLARPASESCFWKVLPPKAALLLTFLTELRNVHHDATNAHQRWPCRVCQKVKASPERGGRGWSHSYREKGRRGRQSRGGVHPGLGSTPGGWEGPSQRGSTGQGEQKEKAMGNHMRPKLPHGGSRIQALGSAEQVSTEMQRPGCCAKPTPAGLATPPRRVNSFLTLKGTIIPQTTVKSGTLRDTLRSAFP